MLLPAFEDGDDRMPCFCFGSNSVAQLRERCQNDALVAEAATLPGYHRIYAGSSAKWGGGGVASLVAAKGSTATRASRPAATLSAARHPTAIGGSW